MADATSAIEIDVRIMAAANAAPATATASAIERTSPPPSDAADHGCDRACRAEALGEGRVRQREPPRLASVAAFAAGADRRSDHSNPSSASAAAQSQRRSPSSDRGASGDGAPGLRVHRANCSALIATGSFRSGRETPANTSRTASAAETAGDGTGHSNHSRTVCRGRLRRPVPQDHDPALEVRPWNSGIERGAKRCRCEVRVLRRRSDRHQVAGNRHSASFTDPRRVRVETHVAIDARQCPVAPGQDRHRLLRLRRHRDRNETKADLERHGRKIAVVDRAAAQVADDDDFPRRGRLSIEPACRIGKRIGHDRPRERRRGKCAFGQLWRWRTDRSNRS